MEAEKAANILFAAEGEKATEKQAAAYEGKRNCRNFRSSKRQRANDSGRSRHRQENI